jgi:hypothetical protein
MKTVSLRYKAAQKLRQTYPFHLSGLGMLLAKFNRYKAALLRSMTVTNFDPKREIKPLVIKTFIDHFS